MSWCARVLSCCVCAVVISCSEAPIEPSEGGSRVDGCSIGDLGVVDESGSRADFVMRVGPAFLDPEPRLIAALWSTGRAVLSSDLVTGGPPFVDVQCDPEDVDVLLGYVESEALLKKDLHYGAEEQHVDMMWQKEGLAFGCSHAALGIYRGDLLPRSESCSDRLGAWLGVRDRLHRLGSAARHRTVVEDPRCTWAESL